MSLEKKIMFNNWVKPCGFPRERVERFLNQPERHSKHSLKRNHKLCKRNGLREHEFRMLKSKESSFRYGGNTMVIANYECVHCGKREYTWTKKGEVSLKIKKMKIVESVV